jgi:hypothetical protein
MFPKKTTILIIVFALICVHLLTLYPSAAQSPSTFFSSATVETSQSIVTQSYGDLWPSCWSDDDALYAANGDGRGFDITGDKSDIDLSQIKGSIDNLTGVRLAKGDQLGTIWGPDVRHFNRKPTGMVCVNGTLYLAIQNLSTVKDSNGKAHNEAPSASISKSTDHGLTWTWDKHTPMFNNHQFTTIFFLDFGKDSVNAIDSYVYIYGLDYNWHESDGTVPDPLDLYLARATPENLQNRSMWQFFSGLDSSGAPTWATDLSGRAAVLHDAHRNAHGSTLLSQGGVVYDKPLNRYLFTSWGGNTWAFYEAPQPWGPWHLFLTQDFGNADTNFGGYATTIPSKFISTDGKTLWVQSNTCTPCGAPVGHYAFALRKLIVVPTSQP